MTNKEVKLVYNHGLKAKDLKHALELAEMYKEEIVDVWNKYHPAFIKVKNRNTIMR